MDGYAVRAADTAPGVAAARSRATIAAGEAADGPLAPGTAVRHHHRRGAPARRRRGPAVEVARGRRRPRHADRALVRPGLHVRYRGEDVRAGDVLAPAGRPARRSRGSPRSPPPASARWPSTAAPALHVLVTGSELLPLGAPPEPGRIHESNGLMVRAARRAAPAPRSLDHGVDRATTARRPARPSRPAWSGDVLVVSGGVSVGPHDHVKPAFEACGVEEVFWRVRIKPGKPLWFGRRGAHARVRPAGQPAVDASSASCSSSSPRCAGCTASADARPALVRGRARRARRAVGRAHDAPHRARSRAGADGVLEATPTERQGSHLTGALAGTQGFVVAPARRRPAAGRARASTSCCCLRTSRRPPGGRAPGPAFGGEVDQAARARPAARARTSAASRRPLGRYQLRSPSSFIVAGQQDRADDRRVDQDRGGEADAELLHRLVASRARRRRT